MKSCTLLFLFAVGSLAATVDVPLSQNYKAPIGIMIAKQITRQFINRLEEQIIRNELINSDTFATIIPPVDDPATLEPINLPDINLPIPGLFNISGSLGFGEATVTGLSKLTDDLSISGVGTVTVDWVMNLPSVAIKTTYSLDLILDLISTHTIVGSGNLEASVDNVFVNLHAFGRVPAIIQKLGLDELDVDLGFSNLILSADKATVDGETEIDWQQAATNVETYFHALWNAEVKCIVNEAVRCSIDHVVNGCTLPDLVAQRFDCLKLNLTESCFGENIEKLDCSPTEKPIVDTTTTTTTTAEPKPTTTEEPKPTTTEEPKPTTTEEPKPTSDGTTEDPESTDDPTTKKPGSDNGSQSNNYVSLVSILIPVVVMIFK